jgi:MFS family permease
MPSSLSALLSELFASSPLRHRAFRLFYFGSIGAALGYTMQATIAAWLMATLTPSALMVALVQTASTLPTLLFGLFAGTLADIVDRRRIILVTQVLLLAATAVLGLATLAGLVGPVALLALTFLVGLGFTFYQPAQQANINELVARTELPRAVALGAVAFNVARAAGPALAGAIAAWISSGSALLASAACFVLMIVAIRRLGARDRPLPGVPERLVSGALSGIRFARHSPAMRSLILRNFTFAVCASAFWALLPVITRDQLRLGAGGFGLLSAGFGTGAVVGALSIPGQLRLRSLNGVVTAAVLLWIASIVLIAIAEFTVLAVVGTFGAGMAWVCVFASLSAGTQSTAPPWVRARAVAMSLVAVQASLAIGSIFWGAWATTGGTRAALLGSAAVMALLHAATWRIRVGMGTEADITPGVQLPELTIVEPPMPDDGPVLIQVDYRVDPDRRAAFLRAVHAAEPIRRRNGAVSWRVFRDLAEDDRVVERFIIPSWAEYVRLRQRMTVADRRTLDALEAFQQPEVPIRVSRLIGISPADADAALVVPPRTGERADDGTDAAVSR